MAFDAFLKIEGIDGGSDDKTHKGEIELLSFSWGESQVGGSGGGGGGGAGKAVLQDFRFVATTSKASPALFLSSATGRHLARATLTCRTSGAGGFEFMKIVLGDVLVSSYDVGSNLAADGFSPLAGTAALPTDEFSLNSQARLRVHRAEDRRDGRGRVHDRLRCRSSGGRRRGRHALGA